MMEWDVVEDDWNLSCEELDMLEKDALRQIEERKSSSAASTFCPPPPHHSSPSSSSLTSFPANPHQAAGSLPSSFLQRPESRNASVKDAVTDLPNLCVKLFLHSSGNITAKFAYHQILVDALRKVPKASWVAKERVWLFPISSLPLAEKMLSDIKGAHVEVLSIDPLVQSALAAAACASDLCDHYDQIPIFIESKLLPFQRDGVRFMLQHGGRVLLADEMGLGKTLQTIAFVSCVQDFWPVLVLTPSSLRLHWASMLQQWLNVPSSDILVVLSQGGSNRQGFTIVPSNVKDRIHFDALFNIVSYDMVPKLQDVLMASDFKTVIADESHFLKNAQAKRTKASLPVLKKAQFAILLTGTPALSRPIELFKQLEALYPDVYKNVHEYGNRYCKGGVFGLYQGASNHEELHNLMKATVMIRRLKKDVLAELPRKRRQQVFLDLDEKNMKHINSLFCQLGIIKSQIKACKSAEEAETLKFSEKNLINQIYNDSAEAKIPAVLDYLSNVIEAGCKFLVFAHHQPMLIAIHQFLQKKKVGCIRIDGTTQQSSRQALVAGFQEKEDIKAAVLSIKAAGVGLTLTAASTVIFAELSWTPGDIIQAEDRAHRIGQVRIDLRSKALCLSVKKGTWEKASSVNVTYLLANDTVDDIIWDVVQSKLENLGQMLDGREDSLDVSASRLSRSSTQSGTLDSFLKRCHTAIDGGSSSGSPKSKCPKI